jgi:hypothetical protein
LILYYLIYNENLLSTFDYIMLVSKDDAMLTLTYLVFLWFSWLRGHCPTPPPFFLSFYLSLSIHIFLFPLFCSPVQFYPFHYSNQLNIFFFGAALSSSVVVFILLHDIPNKDPGMEIILTIDPSLVIFQLTLVRWKDY